ncbi:MAG: shikimate kinase [Betaproteobacteria bacterium]|jgi:shikimate kinase
MNAYPDNIFLVGLMGAGKSTVGRILAKRLGKLFIDSDHEIEKRCGVKIPIIFEMEGEDGFRKRESAVISDLASRTNIVLATGGGSVLLEENRDCLKAHGFIIYLRANPHELWLRTRHDKGRPLLNTADPQMKLKELFDVRDPIYQSIANVVIETGKPNVNQLTNHLVMQLELSS